MYKKNWIKQGAVAAVAAGLMLGALPGVALATTVSENNSIADLPSLEKTWTAPSNTMLVDGKSFDFTLTYKGAEKLNGISYEAPTFKSGDSAGKTFTSDTVTLTYNWKTEANGGVSSKGTLTASEVFENVDFSKPGIYHFQIAEVKPTNADPNIKYDITPKDIYVMVSWDTVNGTTPDFKAVKVQWANGKSYDATKDEYAKGPVVVNNNANDNLGTLEVSKVVTGTAANENDIFSFKVTLTGVSGSYDYDLCTGTKKIKSGTVVAGENVLQLTHNQKVVIKNLPDGAGWTVEETGDLKGYTPSFGNSDNLEKNEGAVEGSKVKASGVLTVTKAGGDTDTVNYKNEKGFAPNAGITANSLPFVGVAAVAAAGAVTLVISRKRRAGEEF